MSEGKKSERDNSGEERLPQVADREVAGRLFPLSGSEILNQVLDHDNPGRLVKNLTRVDLFWLIKRVGEEDSLPLLRLASVDQWQYILDMELWHRDRINQEETTIWLDRLHQADPSRLSQWLFNQDGNLLAHFYFQKILQVETKKEDEDFKDIEDFITVDGLYYIRILDKGHEQEIERILRSLAKEDYTRYQALLLGLAGVIPAEIEEEMYRLKSLRLSEDGYLPFDEAIAVYSHQRPESLKRDGSDYKLYLPEEEEIRAMVPVTPLIQVQGNNILAATLEGVGDSLFLDRIRLEFAGLCNQIFSADSVKFEGIEALTRICKKAAGYINIGLEILSGGSLDISGQYVKNNPLISIFRVGFGRALELKWEAERWKKVAWFQRQDLSPDFWGDEWGGTLKGILREKPLFFSGSKEGEDYRDFEGLEEVESCRTILDRLVILDMLMEAVASRFRINVNMLDDPLVSFYPILFTSWARTILKLEGDFAPLSLDQVKEFFILMRRGDKAPPFRMPGQGDAFIRDLISYLGDFGPGDHVLLKDTLSLLWQDFEEEYALVEVKDMDHRFMKSFLIYPPGIPDESPVPGA